MLALFALALLPRLYRLGVPSLWLDEGSTWGEVTGKSWADLLVELFSPSAGYPLYHLLLKGWAQLGTSEVMLRLPSALAGALAVPAIFALGRRLGGGALGGGAAALALASPFAIWQSQDAKAYSLLIMATVVLQVLLWDALQAGGRRRWLLVLAAAVVGVFVHRLAALTALGALATVLAFKQRRLSPRRRALLYGALLAGALLLVASGTLGVGRAGARIPGTGIAAPRALWLTPVRFALNRYMEADDPQIWLLLPFLALLLLGLLGTFRGAVREPGPERFLLCAAGVPLLLFLALLTAGVPYEPRYMSILYPAFCLMLAWPLRAMPSRLASAAGALLLLCLGASVFALFYRPADDAGSPGIFSGAPVKEQYREAIAYLGQRVHPDDVVIANPPSIAVLYDYYTRQMPEVRWPRVQTITNLGSDDYKWGDFDNDLDAILRGSTRAWLLEAPAHASLINNYIGDAPIDREQLLGKLTINFLYAPEHRKWACDNRPWSEWLGLRVQCQAFPERYLAGSIPRPERPLRARFGENILLQGYTLKLSPGQEGRIVAGAPLPLTLFWEAGADLAGQPDYRVFLHLVRQIGTPPLAQEDAQPQLGGLPTSTWRKGDPIHDEHVITTTARLEPGRYTLLLGLYDPLVPDDPVTPEVEGRLPIRESEAAVGDGYLELLTLEVSAP